MVASFSLYLVISALWDASRAWGTDIRCGFGGGVLGVVQGGLTRLRQQGGEGNRTLVDFLTALTSLGAW